MESLFFVTLLHFHRVSQHVNVVKTYPPLHGLQRERRTVLLFSLRLVFPQGRWENKRTTRGFQDGFQPNFGGDLVQPIRFTSRTQNAIQFRVRKELMGWCWTRGGKKLRRITRTRLYFVEARTSLESWRGTSGCCCCCCCRCCCCCCCCC